MLNFGHVARNMLRTAVALLAMQCTFARAAPKPFEPVSATFDVMESQESSLQSLIETLRKAASDHDLTAIHATLAKSFTVVTCKPDPTLACAPGVKGAKQSATRLSPADRLDQGLCCADIARKVITREMTADAVAGQIDAALDADSMGRNPEAPGSACLPAWPIFDRQKAARMARAAGVKPSNLRLAANDVPIREKPDGRQPVLDTLKAGQIVPLVTDLDTLIPDGWNAIALARGGLGYTDALGLNELAPSGLCFVREGSIWKTGFFVVREE